MKQSDFETQFHWMNGLSEYFRYTGQEDTYEPIFKALYHNNYYRKRDIIMNLIENKYGDLRGVPYEIRRAWINMLLHEHLDEVEVKVSLITSMISSLVGDKFTDRISKFIDYFTLETDNDSQIWAPDLGDFLSRGQVKSKLWLITELANTVDGPIGNVVCYGGWYNFLAHFLFEQFDVKCIYSLDVNRDVIEPCRRLYSEETAADKFKPMGVNVNLIEWNKNTAYAPSRDGDLFEICDNVNVVINTSCEHMNNVWFENIPSGTLVVLQTNDYFENEQHVNCCRDLEDAKSKYPMQNIFYAGELDTQLYNRFMIIGIK